MKTTGILYVETAHGVIVDSPKGMVYLPRETVEVNSAPDPSPADLARESHGGMVVIAYGVIAAFIGLFGGVIGIAIGVWQWWNR